jgi:pimeloyl-ACP methyl ester carboxylesterase
MDQSVSDLDVVLTTLGWNRIHLLGHSYGGNLAYEYAKKHPERVQSLILSNAATTMKVAGDAYDRLAAQNPLGFWKDHVCSVDSPALDDALQHVGSVWAGMEVVLDYVASPPTAAGDVSSLLLFPRSVLVISCVKDFGFESSEGWTEILAGSGVAIKHQRLEHCAHYPHLEDGACFGKLLNDFVSDHDS